MGTIKGRFASAILAWVVAGLFSAASSFGAAVVEESQGNVRAGATPAESKQVGPNQRLPTGSSVVTGTGSQVTLRFDDGQVVTLHENTEFRIVEFHYRPREPKADRAVFALLRGALRLVTGALGKRSREAFALQVPQAVIGVRGTDFMVATVNPAYLSVLQGTVTATNDAGTVTFGAGTFGSIANSSTLAVPISASALPEAAAAAFRNLGALLIMPPDSSAGGEIKLPATAAPARDAASSGLEQANKARELKEDLGREVRRELSDSVRERARDRSR